MNVSMNAHKECILHGRQLTSVMLLASYIGTKSTCQTIVHSRLTKLIREMETKMWIKWKGG